MENSALFILLLPLAGALINGLLGCKLPRRAVEAVACTSVGGSAVFAYGAFASLSGGPSGTVLYDWISFGWFHAPMELSVDELSATMALMVAGVSFLIHVYSVGYMRSDPGYARYFTLLNLFVFSMLVLVLAGNLPMMYLGWEGVGFCSYALIGFWYEDPKNATAGRKAFIVTRVGDVAFGVAILWLFFITGTAGISGINAQAGLIPPATATAIGLLLLFGAAGKSAQLPLSVWLPDAMAGPTPVSALIHAATMVTAGVYLLMRMFPVLSASDTAMAVTAGVGALTAFYAATAALAQSDIKRVLAYSTISQIGFMVLGVGAGAVSGALFHLFVHAFFKALLFMAAGCIIKAMHEEHDIFRMGGLMAKMPVVFMCFLAGALALSAAPGTGGFFSKDEILSAVFAHGTPYYAGLWALGELTAIITAFYIFRVIYLVFLGSGETEPGKIPAAMTLTLVPLALMALAGGIINLPENWHGASALSGLLAAGGLHETAHAANPWLMQGVAALAAVAGIGTAHYVYSIKRDVRLKRVYRFMELISFLHSGWYLDRLYDRAFVRPYVKVAGFLWKSVDERAVDGSLAWAASGLLKAGTKLRVPVTGRASTYVFAVVLGAAAMLLYFAWSFA